MYTKKSDDVPFEEIIPRIILCCYLAAVTVASGVATFMLLDNYESKLIFADYDVIVDAYGTQTLQSLNRNVLTSRLMMETISYSCPYASMWPNCSALTMEHFANVSDIMIEICRLQTITINPIITKNQIGGFEEFAYDFFEDQGYGIEGPHIPLGIRNGVDKGIFFRNSSGLHRSVDYYPHGENEILAPVFLASKLQTNWKAVMFNVYSETLRVKAVDDMLRCVGESGSFLNCASITGVINLVQNSDGTASPAALSLFPIIPSTNRSTVVAIVVSVLDWGQILSDGEATISSAFVILTYGDVKSTYTIKSGVADFVGAGDLHDNDFNGYRRVFTVQSFPATSEMYTIEVYPSADYTDGAATNAPLYGSILSVLVILLTSAIVFLYDRVIINIFREHEIVLKTKRMFVRYISHEIRTPLNTVKIGLSLLRKEIKQLGKNLKNARVPNNVSTRALNSKGEIDVGTTDTIALTNNWIDLIKEISVSSDIAVTVLNDLINYDKVVMGSLQLEVSIVGIWKLIISVTKPFRVHAREKNIGFKILTSDGDMELHSNREVASSTATVDGNGHNTPKESGNVYIVPEAPSSGMPLQKSPSNSLSLSLLGKFACNGENANKNVLDFDKDSFISQDRVNIMDTLVIVADEVKIGQVFRNLVSNSLKFTSTGDVTISINWIREGPSLFENRGNLCVNNLKDTYFNVGRIRISVTDSGIGMTEQNLEELFQEGKQFDANHLQNGEGSGLGLWVSKGFVEQHGGTITATSKGKKKGSTFIVELPVLQSCVDFVPANDTENDFRKKYCGLRNKRSNRIIPINGSSSGSSGSDDIERGAASSNMSSSVLDVPLGEFMNRLSNNNSKVELDNTVRILVVDDAVTNRKIICRMLQSYGYVCEQAENGEEAIEKIFHCPYNFDLILMDFEMPVLNGPKTTKKIREELGMSVPIFGLTGNVLAEDVALFIEHGANVVLFKPLSFALLSVELKKYVRKLSNLEENSV